MNTRSKLSGPKKRSVPAASTQREIPAKVETRPQVLNEPRLVLSLSRCDETSEPKRKRMKTTRRKELKEHQLLQVKRVLRPRVAKGTRREVRREEPEPAERELVRQEEYDGESDEEKAEAKRKWMKKQKMNAVADFFATCDPSFKIRPPARVPPWVAKKLNLFETKSAEGRRTYRRYVHDYKKAMLEFMERLVPAFRGNVDIHGWMRNLSPESWELFKVATSRFTDPTNAMKADPRQYMDQHPSPFRRQRALSVASSDSSWTTFSYSCSSSSSSSSSASSSSGNDW